MTSSIINKLRTDSQLHSIRKLIKNAAPNVAESFIGNRLVENHILLPRYKRYMSTYKNQLPEVFDADSEILDGIRNDGVFMISLEDLKLPNSKQFIDEGDALFQTLCDKAKKQTHKFQITPDFELLLRHSFIFQWGLCDRLRAIATNYIGSPVAYDTCLCNLSLNNGLETATRLWHLDNEDRKVLKVIIYFSDVDVDSGPFQYIPLETTKEITKLTSNQYEFFSDSKMQSFLNQCSESSLKTCTGPAGTVIFVDTARSFHRGKPPTLKSRKAITFGYCSRRPLKPYRCGRNLLSQQQTVNLQIGLTTEQKACINWQDSLPQWIRAIPKFSYI